MVNESNDSTRIENQGKIRSSWLEVFVNDTTRLILILILIVSGWWFTNWVILAEIPPHTGATQGGATQNTGVDAPGISPAIQVCYKYSTRTGLIVIAFAIGIAIASAYIFGTFLYKKFRDTSTWEREQFWTAVSKNIEITKKDAREYIGEFREYEKIILDKRNFYWGLFIRIILAILVVGLISLLISTCKIESQAGLPIISGIIAFIIGQGADSAIHHHRRFISSLRQPPMKTTLRLLVQGRNLKEKHRVPPNKVHVML